MVDNVFAARAGVEVVLGAETASFPRGYITKCYFASDHLNDYKYNQIQLQTQIQIQIQYVQPVYESMEAGQFEIKNGSYSLHQSSPFSWIFKVYHFA